MSSNAAVELVVSGKSCTVKPELKEAIFMCQCKRLLGEVGCGLNTQSGRRSLPAR
jgi:hypothetical protein